MSSLTPFPQSTLENLNTAIWYFIDHNAFDLDLITVTLCDVNSTLPTWCLYCTARDELYPNLNNLANLTNYLQNRLLNGIEVYSISLSHHDQQPCWRIQLVYVSRTRRILRLISNVITHIYNGFLHPEIFLNE